VNDPLDLRDVLADEIVQRRETGYPVDEVAAEAAPALLPNGPDPRPFLDRLARLERDPAWPYEEPTDAAVIRALASSPPPQTPPAGKELYDRILAAWQGRAIGCTLGKPLEGLPPHQVERYLQHAGVAEIDDYLPGVDDLGEDVTLLWRDAVRGRIDGVPRDDDIDYTILGLHVLEEHGLQFTADDVAAEWLDHLPLTRTYTAERAAYRNLAAGLRPPATAEVDNPYREWIGAQIRVDAYGYVCPGDPAAAAELAHVDASVSHVANGVYGARWAAALIAASFTACSAEEALETALATIPPRSRLAESLRNVHASYREGATWREAHRAIADGHAQFHFVHTLQNAAVVAAALLWGAGDFTRTVALAVRGGWDTDCNGATAGSAFGAMHGTAVIPQHWLEPLGDVVHSALADVELPRLSDLARRTWRLAVESRPVEA
jgi:ADP-ribosylglycohydrolase